MRSIALVAAALCLVSTPAVAAPQGNKPPAPAPRSQGQGQAQGAPASGQAQGQKGAGGKQFTMKPAPQMDQLAKMAGTWKCDGTADPTQVSAGGKFKATTKTTKDLNGHWYAMRYEEQKSKDHPAYTMLAHFGWDASSNQFVQFAADDYGGWQHLTGPGWENDKLVWTGDGAMMGQKVRFTQTMTRKSDREMDVTTEAQMDGGQRWSMHLTCKK